MTLLPVNWTCENYRNVWFNTTFPRYFWNSFKVAAITTVITVIVVDVRRLCDRAHPLPRPLSYGLLLLVTQMFPHILLVIPLFMIIRNLGLFNTHAALIIAYTAFSLPFAIWMLRGFFDAIPEELEDAAAIDGASHARHVPQDHPAARRPGPRRGHDVQLHPRVERVPVRAGVPAVAASCSRCRSASRASRRSTPSAGT